MKHIILLLGIFLVSCTKTDSEDPFKSISETPQVLGAGIISTAEFHESINHISTDNTTVYFSRSDKNFETSTLFYSSYANSKWNHPEVLPFSGKHYDANLRFTTDENRAFFTSKRNPELEELSTEWNIWMTTRDGESWNEPEVLPAPINSEGQECCLTVNKNGEAYFASNREGSWDIYEATFFENEFRNVRRLNDTVNSDKGEWPSFITEDGNKMLISSTRKNGIGGDDVYPVNKVDGSWTKPILLEEPVNSVSYEDNPIFSSAGKYLLFSSWKKTDFSEGASNIYVVAYGQD